MKRILTSALLLLAAMTGVLAQSAPANLPPNSVYGRLGNGQTGPGQAIPFATLKLFLDKIIGLYINPAAYGVQCAGGDDTASLQAWLNAVVALHTTALFPASYGGKVCRTTGLTLVAPVGFSIEGEGPTQVEITSTVNNTSTLAILGQNYGQVPFSGGARLFSIRNIKLSAGGNNGIALLLNNALYWSTYNVTTVAGGTIGALFIQGSEGEVYSAQSYGYPALHIGGGLVFEIGSVTSGSTTVTGLNTQPLLVGMSVTGADIQANTVIASCGAVSTSGTFCDPGGNIVLSKTASGTSSTESLTFWSTNITNSGPLNITGGNFQAQGSPNANGAVRLAGNGLGIFFSGCQVVAYGPTVAATVAIDGAPNASNGTVEFANCHGESTYNTSNTGSTFKIGELYKPGPVAIRGGNYFGHGNVTNYQQDFAKVVSAKSLVISGVHASNLGFTGFSRSVVRHESTFPAAGDVYDYRTNVNDGSGPMYSDASGKLTGQTGDANNANQSFGGSFSLSGTLTPPALSGDVNDYTPSGLTSSTVLRVDGGASSRNITGISSGLDGRLLTIINVGTANPIIFKNQSASSTAANRLLVGIDITIDPDKSLTLRYDGTSARWRPWDSIYSSVSVPISRIINTTSPITGGGDLSVDRTFACATCVTSSGGGAITGTAPIAASAAGVISLNTAGVTYAKVQDLGALAVMGRSANSSGVGADIQATAAAGGVLRESGSTIGFGTVATAGIANNAVTLAKLATQAANTVLANATSGAAVPTAFAMPSCSTNTGLALQWLTSTGFQCATISATDISTGTLPAARLPNPTASTLGGIESLTCAANQWLNTISTSGVPACAQPGVSNLSGFGTGVATALGVNVGSAGAPVLFGGALGSPSSVGTLPAHTLGGTITGGGNTITNVALTSSTYNGNSWTAGTGTLTLGASKTLTANNTITFTATDGVTVPIGTATMDALTSGTNATYTVPANAKALRIVMIGPGGGGAGSGTSPSAAGAGGDTCWNTSGTACTTPVLKAGGGAAASGTSAGTGGTATGGTLNEAGGTGQAGVNLANTAGGNGCFSSFGNGGWGGTPTNGGTAAAANSGSGGGGAGTGGTAPTGGGGGCGARLEGIIQGPLAATYVYTIGAGGTAGGAGTGGVAGAAGGSGKILVYPQYNFLLNRDLNPADNDNSPAFIDKAA